LSYFLYFQELNFVFSSFRDLFVSRVGRRKVKKKYYDKYVPMLTIHVGKHFNDKFIFLYHVGDFINSDKWKLMTEYICRTFYTFKTKFYIFIFQGHKNNYLCKYKSEYEYYFLNVDTRMSIVNFNILLNPYSLLSLH